MRVGELSVRGPTAASETKVPDEEGGFPMGVGGWLLIGVIGATVSGIFAARLGTFFLDFCGAKGSGDPPARLRRVIPAGDGGVP